MGISITEIIVIFVVALILFGPEQLPVIARSIGKATGQLKKTSDALRREFYNSVYPPGQDLRREFNAEVGKFRALKAEVLAPPPGSAPAPVRPSQKVESGAQEPAPTPNTSSIVETPQSPSDRKDTLP